VIALDAATVAALREHRTRQLDERIAMGEAWGNELDLVFTQGGRDATPSARLSEGFERHVIAAKLPKLNLHGLRPTHATLALRAGVHPKVVSERLGHASVAFTLDGIHGRAPRHARDSRRGSRSARARAGLEVG